MTNHANSGSYRTHRPLVRSRISQLLLASLTFVLLVGGVPRAVLAQPALVLVVRHAEKADNSNDPVLSAIGNARAVALAEALADAHVDHVIVTQRQRTRLTAAGVISARGLEPEVIGFGADMASHVAAIAEAVRKQTGKVVLVVGHSNTVPDIVHALGGPDMPDLCDSRYAALFTVVPGAVGAPARVVVSSVGVADPPGSERCAGMVPR